MDCPMAVAAVDLPSVKIGRSALGRPSDSPLRPCTQQPVGSPLTARWLACRPGQPLRLQLGGPAPRSPQDPAANPCEPSLLPAPTSAEASLRRAPAEASLQTAPTSGGPLPPAVACLGE